jgi:hypothetical protein
MSKRKHLKLLEAVLTNDTRSIVSAIKESLDERSINKIKAKIDEKTSDYLNESKNIDRLEKYINTNKNPNTAQSARLMFEDDGRDVNVDWQTANGLLTLYNGLKPEQKQSFEKNMDKNLDTFMVLVKFAKEKDLIGSNEEN